MRSGCGGADVAIIGNGLIGSVLARQLAESGARVLLLDAGAAMSEPFGSHLRNSPACQVDRGYFHDLVRAQLRPASLPRPQGRPIGPGWPAMPEGNGINGNQRAKANLPAARVTHLHGGMGTLWNCVAPRLDPEHEQWPGIPAAEWALLYERAEDLLCVGTDLSRRSIRQRFLLTALADLVPTPPRPAPVAARIRNGRPRWTGPAEILAGADPKVRSTIEQLSQHAVRRLRHHGGRVTSAETVDLDTGRTTSIEADVFVVAAGSIRTPGLLWASRIGVRRDAESPLGRYLNEHPLVYGQIVLDYRALPSELADDPDPFVIVPQDGARPFHGLLLCDRYDADALEGRINDRLIVSLYWYVRTPPSWDNRVSFADQPSDALGLPQPTFDYTLSAEDRDAVERALMEMRAVGTRLGEFLPISPPRVLSPGSSMHLMGTTRMGDCADGESVVDGYGQAWGFDNLYLGGTGLIPTATATNPTLAACAVAVRTADRILLRAKEKSALAGG